MELLVYLVLGPFIPVAFWALNGFLLGHEYFLLVATRRLGRQGARAMRGRHRGKVWLAGVLMEQKAYEASAGGGVVTAIAGAAACTAAAACADIPPSVSNR